MKEERESPLFGVGGIDASLGSGLCCAGPLLAVATGVSGAGLAATFDPLRPWFLAATAGRHRRGRAFRDVPELAGARAMRNGG